MATYTSNYNLDKYEGTDSPNLTDQYNSAMDKIDSQLLQNSQAAQTAQTAATTASQAAAAAQTTAEQAQTEAATATSTAEEASTTAAGAANQVATRAPVSHASASTTYGIGTETNYGHVKLTTDFSTQDGGSAIAGSLLPRIMRRLRNVLFCGDSYGVEYDSVDQFYGIGHYLSTLYPDSWNVTNVSIAGTGFVAPNGSSTFPTMISGSTAVNIDTVIVAGGINDMSQSETSIYNGAVSCINNARTKWPTAEIIMVPMLYTWFLPSLKLKKVARAVKQACVDRGAMCIEGAWSWGIGHQNDWYVGASSVHPNSTGAEMMARRIHDCVDAGQVDAFDSITAACTPTAGTPTLNITYDHDVLHITGTVNYKQNPTAPAWFAFGDPFNPSSPVSPQILVLAGAVNTQGHVVWLMYQSSTKELSTGSQDTVVQGEGTVFASCVSAYMLSA